jgi:hypothetical protein
MTMTGGALAPLLAISPDKDTSLAPADDDTGMTAQQVRADACPPNSDSCTAPTATIRHALRTRRRVLSGETVSTAGGAGA